MFPNPIARTLAALGFHGHSHVEEDLDPRTVLANADGETPTSTEPPRPARIPPHMRHLYADRDEALRGYSVGLHRPSSSLAPMSEQLVAVAKSPTKVENGFRGVDEIAEKLVAVARQFQTRDRPKRVNRPAAAASVTNATEDRKRAKAESRPTAPRAAIAENLVPVAKSKKAQKRASKGSGLSEMGGAACPSQQGPPESRTQPRLTRRSR